MDALIDLSERTGEPMSAKYLDGAGRYALKNASWDVCVMATVDSRLARMATTKLDCGACYAFVHEQIGMPFGAWSKAFVDKVSTITAESMPVKGVLIKTGEAERSFKAALTADLRGVDLLCTSEYVRDYVLEWAPPGQRATVCYAADYGLFQGRLFRVMGSHPSREAPCDLSRVCTVVQPQKRCPSRDRAGRRVVFEFSPRVDTVFL